MHMDSPWFAEYCSFGQSIDNAIMISFFVVYFITGSSKLRHLLVIMAIMGFLSEIVGGKILMVYEYRLHNIPVYIPFGHAVLYATAYHISTQKLIWKHHLAIENLIHKAAFIICSMSLVLLNDVAGFIAYIVYLLLLSRRKKPLFYLVMFAVAYYMEFHGTVPRSWSYYAVLENHPELPPTSITPCGIAAIYMFVDLANNASYVYLLKFKKCKYSIQPAINSLLLVVSKLAISHRGWRIS